jgi:hypothetical protein
MAKAAMNKIKTLYRRIRLKIYETSEMLYWSVALFGAETWTLQKVRRSQKPCMFCGVVLGRGGEDQLGASCEK